MLSQGQLSPVATGTATKVSLQLLLTLEQQRPGKSHEPGQVAKWPTESQANKQVS